MTLRILAAVVIGLLGFAACWWLAGWVNRLSHPAPTAPEEPDERDDQEERPASGADEPYAEELRAANEMLPSPDLRTIAEQMDADHEDLAEIGRALDHFGTVMTDALSRFLRNQPQTLLRLPSSIEHTGELPIVEMVGA